VSKFKISTSGLHGLRVLQRRGKNQHQEQKMKKRSDPRHKIRVQTFKILFEKNFRPELKIEKSSTTGQIIDKQREIDGLIKKNAPVWPVSQITSTDLTTLRLAIWELLFNKKKEPYKVIIDEAVEIAKQYGSETSGSFINGVLGSIVKLELKDRGGNKKVRS